MSKKIGQLIKEKLTPSKGNAISRGLRKLVGKGLDASEQDSIQEHIRESIRNNNYAQPTEQKHELIERRFAKDKKLDDGDITNALQEFLSAGIYESILKDRAGGIRLSENSSNFFLISFIAPLLQQGQCLLKCCRVPTTQKS